MYLVYEMIYSFFDTIQSPSENVSVIFFIFFRMGPRFCLRALFWLHSEQST